MKLRPTIFLSGVSSEFASFRDAVETEVQKKDCFPLNQSSFGVDYRTIEEILRRNIGEADAVIHIVGFRFGFEPKDRPAGKPRRSYTQMEYDIAQELNKPIYVFLSADASVRDANPGERPEDAEAIQLQLAHRQFLEQSNNIRYSFQNKNDLCLRAAGIPLLATSDFRVDISRIDRYAPAELIGRENELKLLDDAWLKVRRAESKRPHILTFVALGGEGKTSLVAKWAAQLAYEAWPGCDSAFAWSFYTQGTREQYAASSDLFLKDAITFFGNDADKEFAASPAGAYEKGQRLARIVGQRRALLILDGLEPLQYTPTSPTSGELKDIGVIALLKGLAAHNDGLCIVTSRYSLPDLKAFWQTTSPEIPINRLSQAAGIHLLKTLGVKGLAKELEILVEDVRGHALTLNLLGTYLRDAHRGDIRRRDRIELEEADAEEQGGHAFRVIGAYENAFENEGDHGKNALALLRLMGLFDRPMTAECLAALLEKPPIPDLTHCLSDLTETQLTLAFKRLEDAKLITVNRENTSALVSFDAHPLIRDYFGRQLRTKSPDAWRAAHRRLYQYLCNSTPDKEEPNLEDLQPLYQAVAHGCHAGLHQHAYEEVYVSRILRFNEYYSNKKLGAYGADLGTMAYFFEQPWCRLLSNLSSTAKARLPNQAAFYLRALGRLAEATQPMQLGLTTDVAQKNWLNAGIAASNLSEIELILGHVYDSIKHGNECVIYADRSRDNFQRLSKRARLADVLYQGGQRSEAEALFQEAEQMQREHWPDKPWLYSVQGFLYCDFLLASAERAAWQRTLNHGDFFLDSNIFPTISDRAAQTLKIAERNNWLLSIALDYLTLARVALYKAVLENEVNSKLEITLDDTVQSLRHANAQDYIVRGLLTRAWFRFLTAVHNGFEGSQEDLDEAWEIAERGPMRLLMADIHLYRARLFFREEEYPWERAEADLAAARKLIEQCGYWRRKEELEDAERVILKKSV